MVMTRLNITSGPLKGAKFDLKATPFLVGRSSKSDIQIKDIAVSRQQLKISKVRDKVFLEDLKSTNGTLLNHEKIAPGQSYELADGDTISFANTVMRLDGGSHRVSLDEVPGQQHTDSLPKERRSQWAGNLELVHKVTGLLRQSLKIDEIIDKVLGYLLDTLPRIDRVAILLFDNKNGEMKRVICRSRLEPEESQFVYSRQVVNQVRKDGTPIRMANTDREAPDDFKTAMSTLQIGSVMCVPMISNSEMLGAIYVDSIRGPYGFREDDLLLLESLAGPVAVAIEKAMLASRLEGSLSSIKIIR
ncbi:MAG: FHA domain-containing protein [Desulfatiglandaceae bacterium]